MNYRSSRGYRAIAFMLFFVFAYVLANSTFHFAHATLQQEFNALVMGEIFAAFGVLLLFVAKREEDKELGLR